MLFRSLRAVPRAGAIMMAPLPKRPEGCECAHRVAQSPPPHSAVADPARIQPAPPAPPRIRIPLSATRGPPFKADCHLACPRTSLFPPVAVSLGQAANHARRVRLPLQAPPHWRLWGWQGACCAGDILPTHRVRMHLTVSCLTHPSRSHVCSCGLPRTRSRTAI